MNRSLSPRTSWLALFLAAVVAVVGGGIAVEAGSSGGYPGVLSGALSWTTGLGAITHITGPSDQTFTIAPGASQNIIVKDQNANNAITVFGGALTLGTRTEFSNGVKAGGASTGIQPSGVISINTGSQATTGTSEETLMSFSLPANTLNTDGRGVRITAWGTHATNGNSKTVTLYFGGTTLRARTGTDNGIVWRFDSLVFRTGAATQEGISEISYTGSAGTLQRSTPAETLSGAVTIALKATTASAIGDVTCEGLMVEVLP